MMFPFTSITDPLWLWSNGQSIVTIVLNDAVFKQASEAEDHMQKTHDTEACLCGLWLFEMFLKLGFWSARLQSRVVSLQVGSEDLLEL